MAQIFYPAPTGNAALDQTLRQAFDYIYQLRARPTVAATPATATAPAKISVSAPAAGAASTVEIVSGGGGGGAAAATPEIFFGAYETRPAISPEGTLWIESSRGGTVWSTPNPVYYSTGAGWTLVGGNFAGTTGDAVVLDANSRLVDAGAAPVLITRNINTAVPLTGGGALSADLNLAVSNFVGDSGSGGIRGTVPAPPAGSAAAGQFLAAGGGWAVPSGGGGGGAFASGANILPPNQPSGQSTDWTSTTIACVFRGINLQAFPASWKVRMLFLAGSPTFGAIVVKRTLPFSLAVIDTTAMTIGGMSSGTLTTPGLIETDAVSLQLDYTHDYWVIIYFTSASGNATITVAAGGASSGNAYQGAVMPTMNYGDYYNGDATGLTTIPTWGNGGNRPYLFLGAVMP